MLTIIWHKLANLGRNCLPRAVARRGGRSLIERIGKLCRGAVASNFIKSGTVLAIFIVVVGGWSLVGVRAFWQPRIKLLFGKLSSRSESSWQVTKEEGFYSLELQPDAAVVRAEGGSVLLEIVARPTCESSVDCLPRMRVRLNSDESVLPFVSGCLSKNDVLQNCQMLEDSGWLDWSEISKSDLVKLRIILPSVEDSALFQWTDDVIPEESYQDLSVTVDDRNVYFQGMNAIGSSSMYQPTSFVHVPVVPGCHRVAEDYWSDQNVVSHSCHEANGQKVVMPIPVAPLWSSANGTTWTLVPIESTRASVQHPVKLSEINWAGTYRGQNNIAGDQWLELYNPNEVVVDLYQLKITGAASNYYTIVVNQHLLIGPKGFAIIYYHSESDVLSTSCPRWRSPSLSPAQSNIGVQLWAGTDLLDSAPAKPWQAGTDDWPNRWRTSMQRRWPITDGAQWGSWITAPREKHPGLQSFTTPCDYSGW